MSDFADVINASLRPRSPDDQDDDTGPSMTDVINQSLNPVDRGYHARVFSGLAQASGGDVEKLPPPARRQLGQSARVLSLQGGIMGQAPDQLRQLAGQADDFNERDQQRQQKLTDIYADESAKLLPAFVGAPDRRSLGRFEGERIGPVPEPGVEYQPAVQGFAGRLEKEAPWLSPEERQQHVQAFQQAAPKMAQAHYLDYEMEANRQNPGFVEESRFRQAIPGLRHGLDWADARAMRVASERVEAGTATGDDIREIAQQRVRAEVEAKKGSTDRALDMAAGLPAFMAEYALTGPARGVGRSVAAKLGMNAVGQAAGAGVGYAAANLPALAAGTEQARSRGEGFGTALGKTFVSNVAEGAVFEGLHPFQAKAGNAAWQRVGKGLASGMTANEASADLKALVEQGDVRGGPLTRLALAKTDEEREAAWRDVKATVAVFGGLEGLLNARGQAQARATELKATGLSDTAVRERVRQEFKPLWDQLERMKATNAGELQRLGEDVRDQGADVKLGLLGSVSGGQGIAPPEDTGAHGPGAYQYRYPMEPYQERGDLLPVPVSRGRSIWTPGARQTPEGLAGLLPGPPGEPSPPPPDVRGVQPGGPPGGGVDLALDRSLSWQRRYRELRSGGLSDAAAQLQLRKEFRSRQPAAAAPPVAREPLRGENPDVTAPTPTEQSQGLLRGLNPETAPAAEPAPPAAPFAGASVEDVRNIAQGLGIPANGSKDSIVNRMVTKLGEPLVRQIEEAHRAPSSSSPSGGPGKLSPGVEEITPEKAQADQEARAANLALERAKVSGASPAAIERLRAENNEAVEKAQALRRPPEAEAAQAGDERQVKTPVGTVPESLARSMGYAVPAEPATTSGPSMGLNPAVEQPGKRHPLAKAVADALTHEEVGTAKEVWQRLKAGGKPVKFQAVADALDEAVRRGEVERHAFGPDEDPIYVPYEAPDPEAEAGKSDLYAQTQALRDAAHKSFLESLNADRSAAQRARGAGSETPVLRDFQQDVQKGGAALTAATPPAPTPGATAGEPSPETAAAVRGAAPGRKLTPEELQALRVGNLARARANREPTLPARRPGEGEFAYQNRARRMSGAGTLADRVIERGGIDPASLVNNGFELENWQGIFGKRLLFRAGGQQLDKLADSLARDNVIPPAPEDKHQTQHLLDLLGQHYLVEGGKWYTQEARRQETAAFKEQLRERIARDNPGWTADEVERAVPGLLQAAHGEGGARPPAEVIGESALPEEGETRGDAYEEHGAEPPAVHEVEPGVMFAPPAGAASAPRSGGGGAPVSQYEIMRTAEAVLGPKSYLLSRVPGPKGVQASYDRVADAIRTSKMAAGDAGVDIHERAHDIQDRYGFENDPTRLPADVRDGLKQFDYDPTRPMGRVAMMEGFAEWLRMRSGDALPQMTPEQQAADRWAEARLAQHPELLEKLDRLREMFRRFNAMSTQQKAESYFGQGAARPELTSREAAGSLARKLIDHAYDAWLNRMGPVERAETRAEKNRGMRYLPGAKPSELMYFYGKGGRDAQAILEHGAFSDASGHRVKVGPSLAEIMEPLLPEERGWAGTAAAMIHAESEAAAGRPFVPAEQMRLFADRLAELRQDPAQYARVQEFHDRLTAANNAVLTAMSESGFLDAARVNDLILKRPDYVAALRNAQEQGWQGPRVGKGEQMSNPIKARGQTGQQLVDPLQAYIERAHWAADLLGEQNVRTAVADMLGTPGMGDYGIKVQRPVEANRIGEAHVKTVLKQLGVSDPVIQAVLGQLTGDSATYFTPTEWAPGGENYYVVMRGGKPEYWKIGERPFYDLVTKQQGDFRAIRQTLNGTNPYLRAAAKVAEVLGRSVRAGAVGVSAPFQVIVSASHAYDFFKQTAFRKWSDAYMLPAFFGRAFQFAYSQARGKPSGDFWMKLYDQVMGESAKMFPWERGGAQREYAEATGQKPGVLTRALDIAEGLSKVMTAGFNAPTALEFRKAMEAAGYDKARMEANRAANPDDVFGAPLPVIIAAREAASRAVAKYERAGYMTQAIGKVDPFLTAHSAHLFSYVDSWSKRPGGMAAGLAIYLGLKTLHWLAYHDEPDYLEETGQQRAGDFRVKMPWGDWWRIPGPRGPDALAGALYEEMLRQTKGNNPRFADTLKEALLRQAPPVDVVGAKTAWELRGNEDWRGKPIVPHGMEDLPATDKLRWQVPYAAEQLTGGLATVPGHGTIRNPFGTAQHPHVSLDDYWTELKKGEAQERLRKDRQSKGMNAGKPDAAYLRLKAAEKTMSELNKLLRQHPEREEEIRARQIDLARKALGR